SDSDSTHGGGRIPFVVVSPQAKQHYVSSTLFQHQSLLRLSLQALGIASWPGTAATAPSMSEFFTVPLRQDRRRRLRPRLDVRGGTPCGLLAARLSGAARVVLRYDHPYFLTQP